jgi:hypothetical protein
VNSGGAEGNEHRVRVKRRRATDRWGPTYFILFQINFKFLLNLKFKTEPFPCSKNIKTLYDARSEYFEQLSQLARFQIPNIIHDINFGTDSNLNLL